MAFPPAVWLVRCLSNGGGMGENLQGFGLIEEVPEAGNTFWSVLKGEIRGVDSERWGAGLEYG